MKCPFVLNEIEIIRTDVDIMEYEPVNDNIEPTVIVKTENTTTRQYIMQDCTDDCMMYIDGKCSRRA